MMKTKTKKTVSLAEFIALMALFVSLTAMSIDMVLPALSLIGTDLGVSDGNHTQYIISSLFVGFTVGQLVTGPMADSFGRKFVVYLGLSVFIVGSILCLIASDFSIMLFGRLLQGIGAAAPRNISLTMTRDKYQGRDMARVSSFVMAIFILVPVLAPSFGQAILFFVSWRFIFGIFLIAALITTALTYFRLPETLKPEDKKPFSIKSILHGASKVIGNKTTLGYTICAGLIFGALVGYLNLSRQIFQDYYQVGARFSLYFSVSAISIGVSSIFNSTIVKRYGMNLICHYALLVMIITTALFLIFFFWLPEQQLEQIPIWAFMTYITIIFFCLGLLFGNLNAMAMEPMGHFAGIASGIIGSLSSAISVVIGTIIGQSYNNTLQPLIIGFLILSITSFTLQHFLPKTSKF